MGELILITGTSSGIGLHTAIECARAGHQVIATMRNLERRGELDKAAAEEQVPVSVEQLDIASANAGDKIRELILKYGPPYGLVNNAGIAIGGVFEEQSEEDLREQFETNVFGLMATTRAVLPSMRVHRRGRIINVSSMSGLVGFPAISGYAATKHAVEGLSESLRWEVEAFGIDVLLVEPGSFKTSIFFENLRKGALVDPDGPYATLSRSIEATVKASAEKAPAPDAVAKVIVRLLTANRPPFRSLVGWDARAMTALRRMLPDRVFATGVRQVLGRMRSR